MKDRTYGWMHKLTAVVLLMLYLALKQGGYLG